MAITITKLKMWKDPGYTKGCVEVPPAGSKKLPAPDYTNTTNLRPRKNGTISAIELPLSFCQVFEMSYLYMEFQDNSNNQCKVFGWIDSVEQTASGDEAVLIRWTPDYWRTYSGSVTWGAGVITKCTDGTYKRPYRTQPRHWKSAPGDMIPLSQMIHTCMIYVITVWTVSSTSKIMRFEFPAEPTTNKKWRDPPDPTDYYSLSVRECYNGLIDELLTSYCNTLSPKPSFEIIGCYASSVKSSNWEMYSDDHWNILTSGTKITGTVNGQSRSMLQVSDFRSSYGATFTPSIMTDDMTVYDIIDYHGNRIGCLPYGVEITGVSVDIDIGVNGAYERIIFYSPIFTTSSYMFNRRAKKNLGLEFTIPCVTVPITDNQWSAYLLGGQRDYDVTSARISADQKAVSGLESTVSAGIGGGVTGASAGPLGAIGGLIGGIVAQGTVTAIEYGLDQNFNDQLQDAKDRLYSNQQNGILLTGGSDNWIWGSDSVTHPSGAYMMKLTADSVSQSEYNDDITVNGYDVNIPVTSASSYIATGGALRIENLNLTGSIPPSAKMMIKSKLESGVRIIENNPSGVVP